MIKHPVPERIHPFMDYLEQKALRFLVDFGTENAEAIANQEIEKDLKGRAAQ